MVLSYAASKGAYRGASSEASSQTEPLCAINAFWACGLFLNGDFGHQWSKTEAIFQQKLPTELRYRLLFRSSGFQALMGKSRESCPSFRGGSGHMHFSEWIPSDLISMVTSEVSQFSMSLESLLVFAEAERMQSLRSSHSVLDEMKNPVLRKGRTHFGGEVCPAEPRSPWRRRGGDLVPRRKRSRPRELGTQRMARKNLRNACSGSLELCSSRTRNRSRRSLQTACL